MSRRRIARTTIVDPQAATWRPPVSTQWGDIGALAPETVTLLAAYTIARPTAEFRMASYDLTAPLPVVR